MVTFDVRLSNTAAKSNQWVPVKPGTDLAVILAMCNVIMTEDLYKGEGEEFLKYCLVTPDRKASVADKVAALKAHLKPYTPAMGGRHQRCTRGHHQPGRPRICSGQARLCDQLPRHCRGHYNGVDSERAVQMLAAITGNIDNPGGRTKGCRGQVEAIPRVRKNPKPRR